MAPAVILLKWENCWEKTLKKLEEPNNNVYNGPLNVQQSGEKQHLCFPIRSSKKRKRSDQKKNGDVKALDDEQRTDEKKRHQRHTKDGNAHKNTRHYYTQIKIQRDSETKAVHYFPSTTLTRLNSATFLMYLFFA